MPNSIFRSNILLNTVNMAIIDRIMIAEISAKGREAADIIRSKFAAINQTAALKRTNDRLSRTEEGMELARAEVLELYEILESRVCDLRGEILPLPVTKART